MLTVTFLVVIIIIILIFILIFSPFSKNPYYSYSQETNQKEIKTK